MKKQELRVLGGNSAKNENLKMPAEICDKT